MKKIIIDFSSAILFWQQKKLRLDLLKISLLLRFKVHKFDSK